MPAFSPFPQYFQKAYFSLYSIDTHFNALKKQTAFENIVGKKEIACNSQCFLLNQKIVYPFINTYDVISLFATDLEESKIDMWGKGLKKNFIGILYKWDTKQDMLTFRTVLLQ